ncbi:MAG: hypothetical protein JKY62_16295 [Desulfocapsa sp.]|nr:hypothetical protein [Desulfocapsa sp.]
MSLSVKDLRTRLCFVAVPVSLVLASAVAIWFGAIRDSQFQESSLRVPGFDYRKDTQEYKEPSTTFKSEEPRRNIFGFNKVGKKEEKNLEMMELGLGLIVIKGQRRFCLTNGVMMAESQSGNGYLVYRIEENRVWYKIGKSLLPLQPGDKISVDAEGNIRGIPDNERQMNNDDGDLKLNDIQGKE